MAVRLGIDEGDDLDLNHDINVTPFIDVMLVLLIIFMVAAPLATVDLHVNLPASTAQPQQRPDRPVFVTLKSDLAVAVGETGVPRDGLAAALATALGDKTQPLFVRADRSVPYGDLMGLLNDLRDAGYLKIALVGLDKSAPP